MLRHPKHTLFLAITAAITIAGYAYTQKGTTIDTINVKRGTAAEIIYATGIIEPIEHALISPETTARLEEFLVREGQAVKKGDLLARLNDREQKAELARFESLVENSRIELQRAETLWKRKSGSRENFDTAQSRLDQALAQRDAARERLAKLQIRAPFDGIILRRENDPGEIVTPTTPLFEIGQPKYLRATLEIDEEDRPGVFLKQKVLLSTDAFPDQVFETTVTSITPAGDPLNKSYRVRTNLPADTPLPVGMTVEANLIEQEKHNTLLVPSAAIIKLTPEATESETQPARAVFRIKGNHAEKTPVTTGITGAEQTEILSGLKEGDLIISTPPAGLNTGDRISYSQSP